ncbi:galanin receptor type 1-like [Clytia hemisphaerica]|uniref:G-protein coupled receptors family 1 profile domain-containing protein n=1 Tax=Clytia hemisphaerica TaxID=252671 RepID=A0A7M6DIZ7_9CNID
MNSSITDNHCRTVYQNATKSEITCCNFTKPHSNTTINNCTGNTKSPFGDWPPQPWNSIYISFMIIVMLLVFFSNACVIYKINPWRKRKQHSNIELLILYLSMSDIANIFFLFADIYENLTDFRYWPFGWFGCKVIYPSFNVSLCISVCILIIMSVDRCRSITAPLKSKFSRRSIHLAALISIILSFAVNWFQFEHHTYEHEKCFVRRHSNIDFLQNKIIVTCVRDLIYFLVFTLTAYWISNSLRHHNLLDTKQNRKSDVVMMLITMETVFGVLILPYDVFDVAMMISRLPGSSPIKFTERIWHIDRILAILQMSNSFVNCFVYAKMHKYVLKKKRNASNSSAGTVATTNGSRNENRRGSQDVFGSSVNPNCATSIFMDTN